MVNYMYLNLWGSLGFYSSMELIFVPWLRRLLLMREIFFNLHILKDLFLIGLLKLEVNVKYKIFPF